MIDTFELDRAIPRDALLTQLKDHSKAPASARGHHDAQPAAEFYALGQNVGIVLDGKFIGVDIDRPDIDEARFLAKRLDETGTWRQRTPHGRHWLFRIPAGLELGNGILPDNFGNSYGDMKTLGFLVAPGSEVRCDGRKHGGAPCAAEAYAIECATDPVPAPDWILALAAAGHKAAREASGARRDTIPVGEHDNAMSAILGQVARSLQARLSEDALARVGRAIVREAGILEPSAHRPFGEGDFRRWAGSAVRHGDDKPLYDNVGDLAPAGWVEGVEALEAADRTPKRWWVPGFFPRGELVMLFGRGGIGKSTAAAWLAAQVTREGGTVGYLGVEEPFAKFIDRAVLAGGDFNRMVAAPQATLFPRDLPALEVNLRLRGVDVLYIDSIYSHFETTAHGENAAVHARRCLGPLAALAMRSGVTIIGTFHENKAGEFLGSVEMVNVARHIIKAYRKRSGPLMLRVWKTNLKEPGYELGLHGEELDRVDPLTGELVYEIDEAGGLAAERIIIPTRTERILASIELSEDDLAPPDGQTVREAMTETKRRYRKNVSV